MQILGRDRPLTHYLYMCDFVKIMFHTALDESVGAGVVNQTSINLNWFHHRFVNGQRDTTVESNISFPYCKPTPFLKHCRINWTDSIQIP